MAVNLKAPIKRDLHLSQNSHLESSTQKKFNSELPRTSASSCICRWIHCGDTCYPYAWIDQENTVG